MTTQRFKCECSSHQISETTQHQFCLLCWLKLSQTCQDSRRDIDPQPSLERVLENFRVMFQNFFNVCLLTLGFHFSELILKITFLILSSLSEMLTISQRVTLNIKIKYLLIKFYLQFLVEIECEEIVIIFITKLFHFISPTENMC